MEDEKKIKVSVNEFIKNLRVIIKERLYDSAKEQIIGDTELIEQSLDICDLCKKYNLTNKANKLYISCFAKIPQDIRKKIYTHLPVNVKMLNCYVKKCDISGVCYCLKENDVKPNKKTMKLFINNMNNYINDKYLGLFINNGYEITEDDICYMLDKHIIISDLDKYGIVMSKKIANHCVKNGILKYNIDEYVSKQEQLYIFIRNINVSYSKVVDEFNKYVKKNKNIVDIECLHIACEIGLSELVVYLCKKYDFIPDKKCFTSYENSKDIILSTLLNKLFKKK